MRKFRSRPLRFLQSLCHRVSSRDHPYCILTIDRSMRLALETDLALKVVYTSGGVCYTYTLQGRRHMFVRWQWWGDRRRGSERRYCRDIADAHAILVESTRVDGKPRQRHVAYLGSVHNVYREQTPYYRAKF